MATQSQNPGSASTDDEEGPTSAEQPVPRRSAFWFFMQHVFYGLFVVCFRYRIRGLENVPKSGPALVLVNHQSHLDPMLAAVGMSRPVSFIGRESLKKIPGMPWFFKQANAISISRTATSGSSIRAAVEFLQNGHMVGIFPEGTRTTNGEMSEFKPGFSSIARRCPVPIIPIGIAGAHLAMPRGSLWIWPRRVRVVIGKPISAAETEQLSQRGADPGLLQTAFEHVANCQAAAETWRKEG